MATSKKYDHEDLDFQMMFYEGVLRRRSDYIEVLIALGEIYTRKGFYDKGLAVDRKLSVLRPENPIVFYNLACSLSLVGDVVNSLEAIKRAVGLGYNDFQYLTQDPDLTNLRRDVRFEKYLEEIKKTAPRRKKCVKKSRA
jgi:hypothetical protein